MKVKEVYNAAWEENWGFVPMTEREIDFIARAAFPMFLIMIIAVGILVAFPEIATLLPDAMSARN